VQRVPPAALQPHQAFGVERLSRFRLSPENSYNVRPQVAIFVLKTNSIKDHLSLFVAVNESFTALLHHMVKACGFMGASFGPGMLPVFLAIDKDNIANGTGEVDYGASCFCHKVLIFKAI
jgi:hypothetical protein